MLFADFPNSKFWFPEFVSSYNWHVTTCHGHNPIVSINVLFFLQNLNLDDDTVLDAIKFTEEDGVPVVSTSATEQALILGIM